MLFKNLNFEKLFFFNKNKQTFIKNIEINITKHCNLNCQCCTHFSPLAQEEVLSVEDFRKQIKQLAKITNGNIGTISIMGGEPLLNPHCAEILAITRQEFPTPSIQFVTNGILLLQQSVEFWETLRDCNIVLCPTKYPIDIDWEKIKQLVDSYNIYFYIYNYKETVKQSNKISITEFNIVDYEKNFKHCTLRDITYEKGRIYPCPISAFIQYFNNYFNKNIPVSQNDYIDIFKVNDIKKIHKFLSRPIPMCKHCCGSKLLKMGDWKRSSYDIYEWLYQK